jgi:tRNA (guanine26-N2/guanine27-N2)-dimethyltransferase
LKQFDSKITEITEGTTKILVPLASLNETVPPREPAFFNPRARLCRDFSILAYSAFIKNFDGPKLFLEGLSGVGSMGLRVSNEIPQVDKVVINDLNPKALCLANSSSELNQLKNFEISENETCRFLSTFSKKNHRGTIVDIDPFGSPAKFIDCGIRATVHGGMLSITATDLQVLHGIFQNACKRRYGGNTIKTEYSNELSIRLILGCIQSIAARLDITIEPLFAETDQHYYRTYVRILNRPDQENNMGFIFHCKTCGNRGVLDILKSNDKICTNCNSSIDLIAGPLWLGHLFEKEFLEKMLIEYNSHAVSKLCSPIIQKCILESKVLCLSPTYFTLDEIASRMKKSPIRLEQMIERLHKNGFEASPTSLKPTGFRTSAKINDIFELLS